MKYSKFLEVAQRADGFADLQKFFIDYSGLKDLILKLELMQGDKIVDIDSVLETDLRRQFNDGLAADVQKIDEVAQRLVSVLDQDFKLLGKTLPPTPTKLGKDGEAQPDVKTVSAAGASELDELYQKARLIKQYCELNAEGVRKIAKKYDKRAGGKNEQDRRIADMKATAFGNGSIDTSIQKIERVLLSQGKIQPEDETAALCQKEGIHVGRAGETDVGIVHKFVQVLGGMLGAQCDMVSKNEELIVAIDIPDPNMPEGEEKKAAQKAAVDKWALKTMKSNGKTWGDKNCQERVYTAIETTIKLCLVALLLYMFIISLGLMGNAFKVLGGKSSGRAFRQSELFSNPVAGLSLGILATVLVQSSSTSTSVIITMSAADLVSMKNAIPMIMGANIGTAVTASIVSLAQIGDRDQYRRAFGGAIVHYCFNILTVVILLPLEVATGMIQAIAEGMVNAFGITNDDEKGGKQDFLKIITKPVSSRLLQVDKKLVTSIAKESDPVKLAALEAKSIIKNGQSNDNHLFMDTPMSEGVAGCLLIIVSLLFLSICLVLLVKTLQSVFRGRAAIWIGKFLNLEIKSCPLIGDYILMVFGMGLTILMQSSSVTTSTLTPLVGIGLIRVDKMFPFTIGANIGTTVTGILAALASSNMQVGFQVAMSHLLFNVLGTIMWFMVPTTRAVPLAMAKFMGDLAAEVKIFPVLLIVFAWVLCPGGLLFLSMAGVAVVGVIGGIIMLSTLVVIAIIALRSWMPRKLPGFLTGNPSWCPPALCTGDYQEVRRETWNRGAGSASAASEQKESSTDAKAGSWWQAPMAWGSGWFILMALVVAIPNCQWSNLKYPKFDGRDHVGIGAWEACSSMYESNQGWAPPRTECSLADFTACAPIKGCGDADFSDTAGSNALYEKSWTACKKSCSLKSWSAHCISMGCKGSLHSVQCNNVTNAVQPAYQVSYKTDSGNAWAAGNACRSVSELCDNSTKLGQAGSFGWLGFVFVVIGQIALMTYGTMGQAKRDKVLLGSFASFCLAWFWLLISWAIFASAVSGQATCTIMDASDTGAIIATGSFGDIINAQGSYGNAFVIGSWVLLTLVLGVIGHRIIAERKRKIASE